MNHIQVGYKRCSNVCPEGRPCCCNGRIQHTLHICSNPKCDCHKVERYAHAVSVEETQEQEAEHARINQP
jgi:hypothetical protein